MVKNSKKKVSKKFSTAKTYIKKIGEKVAKSKLGEKIKQKVQKVVLKVKKMKSFSQLAAFASKFKEKVLEKSKIFWNGPVSWKLPPSTVNIEEFYEIQKITPLIFSTYCQEKDVTEFTCFYCQSFKDKLISLKRIKSKKEYNVALVGETQDYNFVVFRGSYTRTERKGQIWIGIQNWFTNMQQTKSSFLDFPKDQKVHTGFKNAYMTLRQEILNHLKTLPKKPVYIGGHSRGGATATLGAYDLQNLGYQVTLLAISTPRVGNEAFVKAFYESDVGFSSFRYDNLNDPAPHVSPAFLGYRHVPNEVFESPPNSFNFTICGVDPDKPWVLDRNCNVGGKVKKFDVFNHGRYNGWDVSEIQEKYGC